jgi:MurNAc alpha-1-phosphate uridylyltransferase
VTLAPAMILAAGRGERMRPLTDTCPKPLLAVRGKPLMQYPLEALARAGLRDVVVNTGWLGEQVEARFGSRPDFGTGGALRIHYSHEGRDFGGPIETAGGIARALPLLADSFWLAAGDVFMPGFAFSRDQLARFAAGGALAHLLLVPNPDHNPRGDFGLDSAGLALNDAPLRYTYSTVGMYRQALFAALPHGNPQGLKAPLAPVLRAAIARGEVTAELYLGPWTDVGTPQRLAALQSPEDSPRLASS